MHDSATAPERVRVVPHLVVDQGPVCNVRYEWISGLHDLQPQPARVELMLGASGFERLGIASPGRSGGLVRVYRP
jgi:hypothetical protein